MRIFLIAQVIIFSTFTAVSQPESATQIAREITNNVFENKNLPGIAVAVARGHEWVWTDAYGYANIVDSTAIDPRRSLFRIGSVSKTLTAAGLMLLYQQGKIDLDAEIHKYVSEFPKKRYPVTIRQIAQHVGGIRHYNDGEFLNDTHYNTVRDGLVIFANDSLLFQPGTRFLYSSYGWNLISAAMETASGQEFLKYMADNIFSPAGMTSTYPDDVTSVMSNRVSFYEKGKKISAAVDNSYKWASGGYLSTSTDLVRLGQAILDNAIISEKTLEEALQTYTLPNGKQTKYGIGFEVGEDKKGRTWFGHGGGSVGGTTMFLIYPEADLIVVVLTNQSGAGIKKLAFSLANAFLKE